MWEVYYNKINSPNMPDGFEVYIDESDSVEGQFIARIYRIDDFGDLDLTNEVVFDFIPTLDELTDHFVFSY